MKNFNEKIKKHQKEWFVQEYKDVKGWDSAHDHILLKEDEMYNLYPGIRDTLFEHLKKHSISAHRGIGNLNSSWALCANLYWPFKDGEGCELLKQYLSNNSGIVIERIEAMKLEFEDVDEDYKPVNLLGEPPQGSSGIGQTSPDLAIEFSTKDKKKGIFLVESKFCEANFSTCSGYKASAEDQCVTKNIINSKYEKCNLKSKLGRKYWDLLQDDLDEKAYKSFSICPIKKLYQLFRQQALAKGLQNKYDIVISTVFRIKGNEALFRSFSRVGLGDFPMGWKKLFPNLLFKSFFHDDWFEFVKENNCNSAWDEWIKYVGRRYLEVKEVG